MKPLKIQRQYVAAQNHFDKKEYHDVLGILNKLLDVHKDPRHYALLGATLLKLKMKTEAAQAFQIAGEMESPHKLKYTREAMRLHFSNNDDINVLRLGARNLKEAIADPDMAVLMSGALMRQELDGAEAFRNTLAKSDEPTHRQLAARSIRLQDRSDEENKCILEIFEKDPEDRIVRNFYLSAMRDALDYDVIRKYEPIQLEEIARGEFEAVADEVSLFNLRWCDDEKTNAVAGSRMGERKPKNAASKRHNMPHRWGHKLRIGYLSADLWTEHAVMKALRGILESHDKSRFDITLFCNAPAERLRNDNNAIREEWGRVVRIRGMTDDEAAEAIKAENIDILVDLQGHTAENRVFVMNRPTAPVHATWLGYPGTVVNVDIDYLIADSTVVPESSFPNYYEKVVWMPETFFPNEAVHRPMPQPIDRALCNMPEDAFIFSCFHSHWKFTPATIDLWVRVLKETPESLLFLICRERFGARKNLIKAFAEAGIPESRLMFGDRVNNYAAYINRIGLTDLGLDTYPYNGHTTTSEKLWAGLPMLTYKGKNFASRVSESLLNSLGLPELVSDDPDDFVRRAVHYYNNREELKEVRKRLEANRFTHPLFDAERYTRHLETAYTMMADRAKAKAKPDHFSVPALPPREGPFSTRTN